MDEERKLSRRIFIVPDNVGIEEYVRFIIGCLEKEAHFGFRIDELEALQKKLEEISLVLQKNRQSILAGTGLDILEYSFIEMQKVMTYFRLIQDELAIRDCQDLALDVIRQIELMARGSDISKRNKAFEKFHFDLGKVHRYIFPLVEQLRVARDFELNTLVSQYQRDGLKRTSRRMRRFSREDVAQSLFEEDSGVLQDKEVRNTTVIKDMDSFIGEGETKERGKEIMPAEFDRFENTWRLEKEKSEEASAAFSVEDALEKVFSESEDDKICFEDSNPENKKTGTFSNKKGEPVTTVKFTGKTYPWSKQESLSDKVL